MVSLVRSIISLASDFGLLANFEDWIGLNHDYNMTKGAYVLEARAVSRAPPIVTSRDAP